MAAAKAHRNQTVGDVQIVQEPTELRTVVVVARTRAVEVSGILHTAVGVLHDQIELRGQLVVDQNRAADTASDTGWEQWAGRRSFAADMKM